jgi:perosamine synthetase
VFAGRASADLPVADRATSQILSLPLHPRLSQDDVRRVASAVAAFEKGRAFA